MREAIACGAVRIEFRMLTELNENGKPEGQLQYGRVNKAMRGFGPIVTAKINPPVEAWVEFHSAEVAARAAQAMEDPILVQTADSSKWVVTFSDGDRQAAIASGVTRIEFDGSTGTQVHFYAALL